MKETGLSGLTLGEFIRGAEMAPFLAVDTETNGEDIRDGRGFAIGLSISWGLPGSISRTDYFPFRHKNGNNLEHDILLQLKKLLESHACLVFHNAKFDLVSLETLGIKIGYYQKFYDTMLMAHLIDENRPFSGKGLDSVSKYYLEDEGKRKSNDFIKAVENFGWGGVPSWLMAEYAAYDADMTRRLFDFLKPKFDAEGLENYWEYKRKFVHVIKRMESRGVRVDTKLCEFESTLGESQMQDILEILGYENMGPKALEDLLISKLELPVVKSSAKTGKPSFDKEAMAQYEEMLERTDDSTAKYVLAYRGWQKSVSSNYRAYLELLSPDGRLRPNYKLHGTRTGRMSCEKPNLQQIPRVSEKPWNGKMKSAFIAAPGYKLWEADYGQLELRLATAYANERSLIDIFGDDRDVFTEMAEELGMARHDTKTLVYTIQYGGGITRLSTVFGISADRATEIREDFYARYQGFRHISNVAQRTTQRKGKIKLWSGRYRHFLDRTNEAHKAFNSVIQGGAADIVERSMIRLYEELDNDECRMLLQVHDSVVFEIKEGMEEKYLPEIERIMTDVRTDNTEQPTFGVRFKVDIHQWGAG